MDVKQLKELIDAGENEEVEFKESLSTIKEAGKVLCAFANTNGGILLFGVKDNKKIEGIKGNLDVHQQRISALIQTIHPTPNASIKINRIEGKDVIVVSIQKTDIENFYSFQGSIYVRLGSTTKRLEAPQMVEFLQSKKVLCFDETISNATIDDIKKEYVEEYLKIRKQEGFLKSKSIEEFLINAKLARRNGDLRIKDAAILLFGKDPCSMFPQIEVKLVKFKGNEAVDIISHKIIKSILPEQIEQVMSFVRQNISKEIEIGSEAKRKEKYEYPLSVIREAIVNSIAHRDYFSKDSIQINIFEDRLEVVGPGTLPSGLTRELLGQLSVQRNPILYHILRDLGYVEGLGTGIPRMRNDMRKHGLSDPEFDINPSFFRVILKNKKAGLEPIESIKDLNERQKRGLRYILKHKSIKSDVYAKINSISHGTAVTEINEMIHFKYLKKVGVYRGAYYIFGEKIKII